VVPALIATYCGVPIAPLYGHAAIRARLGTALSRGTLPASLLLTGPRGVGKQRLALWLAQAVVCEGPGERPCGTCAQCRYSRELTHPDIQWFFPRTRPKDSDPSLAEVRSDYAEAIAERVKNLGLYPPATGLDGLFVATIRALVQQASLSPAMARRKVFVVGDAERMVPQEGADAAANAFLKLLEEPPPDTTIIITSSEPGALLPTIRSRVVCVRVPPVTEADVRDFLGDPAVVAALGERGDVQALVELASGAPGTLLGSGGLKRALDDARRLLEAATRGGRPDMMRAAFTRGAAGARGAFSDTLDALTVVLRDEARDASAWSSDGVPRDAARALAASRSIAAVEQAKGRAEGNVNPQLLTAWLLREIAGAFR
jgi:DNA polymerase-3 subunit delta'